MTSTFPFSQFQKLKLINLKRLSIIMGFFLTGFSFSNFSNAQTSPADCKTGCTSNDVQIQMAYLSDINGNKLPATFVCPASGTATVYLTLELTTKTPRVGVVIYSKIKTFTPPSTIGNELTTISQCFGIALNQPTNKVTFTAPFNWTCGTPIVLTDVFIGWGTGNTNFCTGNGFQCPATSSKCYSLPPGQYIPIVTPNADPASATLCSTQPGGTTAVFNLTTLNSTVINGQSNVTVSWFSDAALANAIATPTAYTSATGSVYAKVTSTISPFPYSSSTVSLIVHTTPAAPILGKVDNCDGTSTITATGLVSGATLIWSDGGSGNPRTVSSTTALTVTQSLNGCTSSVSNSVTPAPKTTPSAPVLGKVDNCDGTSTVTATGLAAGATLTWSDGGNGNPRTVTSTTALTVTQTVNGCTSGSSNSITPAPKTKPAAPTLGKVDNCDGTSTITATGLVNGATLVWSDGGNGNPRSVTTTTALTVTQTVNGCTSDASNSVSPAPKTTPAAPGVSVTDNCDGSSDLSATNYSGSLLWNTTETSASIHVTVGGTYTVTQTVNGCTSSAGSGVAAPKSTPLTPTICVVQPSLCGPATGSITVTAPLGSDYQYSIDNGSHWQTGNTFSSLAAGSVSGIKVQSPGGCISSSVNCDASDCSSPQTALSVTQPSTQISLQTTVKAYPNPFNNDVKFVVNASKSGNGTLEIFNIMGQKVKTVYQGHVSAGVNNFDLNLPGQKYANLIYRFILDNKILTGKLIQLNQ